METNKFLVNFLKDKYMTSFSKMIMASLVAASAFLTGCASGPQYYPANDYYPSSGQVVYQRPLSQMVATPVQYQAQPQYHQYYPQTAPVYQPAYQNQRNTGYAQPQYVQQYAPVQRGQSYQGVSVGTIAGGLIGSQIGHGRGAIAGSALGAGIGAVVGSGCGVTPGNAIGGLVGGLLGSQVGGGNGQRVAAALGAGMGVATGNNMSGC